MIIGHAGVTVPAMGTLVTIEIEESGFRWHENHANETRFREDCPYCVAFDWFQRVEACCTRFDPTSELMQLTARVGEPVPASDILFQAVQVAYAVAEATGGAFDPTVGAAMQARGFDRHYATGAAHRTNVDTVTDPSYRDIHIDADAQTITLLRPVVLDLGGIAKGLAIDLAARSLAHFANFAIDAGGDVYLAGTKAGGDPWTVGIRHPRHETAVIETLCLSNVAVCTSGDYERQAPERADEHHLIDPRRRAPATECASVTVIAPSAMLADSLSTAAFVLGPAEGIALLERAGVEGLAITPDLQRFATPRLGDVVLSHA